MFSITVEKNPEEIKNDPHNERIRVQDCFHERIKIDNHHLNPNKNSKSNSATPTSPMNSANSFGYSQNNEDFKEDEDHTCVLKNFQFGNPNIEEIHGIIKLYKIIKSKDEISQIDKEFRSYYVNIEDSSSSSSPQKNITKNTTNNSTNSINLNNLKSDMLCILAIPSFFEIKDLFAFFDREFYLPSNDKGGKEIIKNIRVIRDMSPNKYLCVIKFISQEIADDFFVQMNGKRFTKIDPEECRVVYVKEFEILDSKHSKNKESEDKNSKRIKENQNNNNNIKDNENGMAKQDMIEMPTCPVCLERLDDETSGILTTICNHQFHSSCLRKWGTSTCPVCRYSSLDEERNNCCCDVCGAIDNLWICLTCSHVGCGRYINAHSRQHAVNSGHPFAMELSTRNSGMNQYDNDSSCNCVWDYSTDSFVHRIVEQDVDGKLIALDGKEGYENQLKKKAEYLENEYNKLLVDTLTKQRLFFENKLKMVEKENEEKLNSIKKEKELKEFEVKAIEEEKMKLENRIKNEKSMEKNKEKKISDEIKFLKEMNQSLSSNQESFKRILKEMGEKHEKEMKKKESFINELQEQMKDLYAHLEMQSKISKNEEIKDAKIAYIPNATQKNTNKKKKKN